MTAGTHITDAALGIFFGGTLEEKLARPDISDFAFDAAFNRLPSWENGPTLEPARAAGLRTVPHGASAWKVPGRAEISNDRRRGELLHFFANHELLAIETMAYAILRWGAGDPRYCRDTYRIIRQEQDHLQLYRGRMAALGVEFGEMGLNDFFWRAVRPLRTREQFLAVMSLTFEQANLDYACHYQQLFREIGDVESAVVMERVYREEIAHVAHGVRHLFGAGDAKVPPGEASERQWDAYTAQLPPQISPTRAVGLGFDRAGRLKAGLSADFIDRLSTFGRAYGKPGQLWVYDPEFEMGFWQRSPTAVPPGLGETGPLADNVNDLAFLMTYLASPHDVVAVGCSPRLDFLAGLREATGLKLPFYRQIPSGLPGVLAESSPSPSRGEESRHAHPGRFANVQAQSRWSGLPENGFSATEEEAGRRACSKATAWAINRRLTDILRSEGLPVVKEADLGGLCGSLREVEERLADATHPQMIKEFFNASGRGNRVLWPSAASPVMNARGINHGIRLSANLRPWVERALARSGGVIVQRFFRERQDWSCFLKPGKLSADRMGPFLPAWTQSSGTYLGHGLGAGFPLLPRHITGLLLERSGMNLNALTAHLAERLQLILKEEFQHWQGPMGLDLMVVVDEATGRPLLYGLNEINPRWTMGACALRLRELIAPSHCGLFTIHLKSDLQPSALDDCFNRASGIVALERNGQHRLAAGSVFLVDPRQCRRFVAILHVSESLAGLKQQVASVVVSNQDSRLLKFDSYLESEKAFPT